MANWAGARPEPPKETGEAEAASPDLNQASMS
jgi:hypothetical protein